MGGPLDGLPVGASVEAGGATIVNIEGYDLVLHNLMGLDVLHQDKRWREADGTISELADLTVSHRHNLLAFLRRRARSLAFVDAQAMWCGPLAPRGDIASMAAEEFTDWQMDHPEEWLEDTALVTRLREMVAEDEKRVPTKEWWED